MVFDGCGVVECGDPCSAVEKTCGFSNECCSKLDPAEACLGRCGDVYDPCDFSTISCGDADCQGAPCNQATNQCCVVGQNPCAEGVCGVIFDSCSPGVDCGACAGTDACIGNLCQPSGCGSAECGYLSSGEHCGDCDPGDRCVDGKCTALCGE